MRVQIDESRSYGETIEIDPARGDTFVEIADGNDTAVSDPDIRLEPRVPCTVDDVGIQEQEIELLRGRRRGSKKEPENRAFIHGPRSLSHLDPVTDVARRRPG
jgi:hypothetical protein